MLLDVPHMVVATVVGAAAVGAWTDLRSARIPNGLTLPLLGAAPCVWAVCDGWSGALGSVVGALVCGAIPLLCFVQGAMGGGDVKLLAALGALLHWRVGLELELWSFIGAAVYGLLAVSVRGRLRDVLRQCGRLLRRGALLGRGVRGPQGDHVVEGSDAGLLLTPLRFGPFILCATLLVAWAIIQ